jgi:hypothetical protein
MHDAGSIFQSISLTSEELKKPLAPRAPTANFGRAVCTVTARAVDNYAFSLEHIAHLFREILEARNNNVGKFWRWILHVVFS